MLKLFFLIFLTVGSLVDSIPLDEPVIEGHIIGGNKTDISKVPYQVAVYALNVYICGGFIVSPSYIVTAAFCQHLLDDSMFKIRAGSSSLEKDGVIVRIKKFFLHPKYNHWNGDYDVGVIQLATPLPLNDKTMKPIKLAAKEPSTGSLALVSGWGALDDNGRPLETLQSVTLPLYDRTKCATDLKPYNITITPRMICAYIKGKSSEIGDTGGPLMYNNEVVGVYSVRFPDTNEILPNVFTNIANPEITNFIKEIAKL